MNFEFLIVFSPYSVSDIKHLCSFYRIRPSKGRGQNFLIDAKIADDMIGAAELTRESDVIEVGPGFGALTFKLATQCRQVTAIEIEKGLARALREELSERDIENVEVEEGDALQWMHRRAASLAHASIVASLPYSITSDFFSAILRDEHLPAQLVLLVQREVAARLTARPPYMSMLSVVAQWYGAVSTHARVPASAFWPQPEVESAIVRIDTSHPAPHRAQHESREFFSFARRAFASPRRKLANTLKGFASQEASRAKELLARRPQELSLEDWIFLFQEN